MNEEEKKTSEELKEFIQGPCEICRYCSGAYRLNRKNIIQLLNLIKKLQKENEELLEVKVSASAHNRILELEKENEELKERIREHTLLISPYYVKENFIPVQKVKDKIEGLNSRIEIYREYVEQGIETDVEWVDNVADRETVKVLQELLEGRK